MRRGIIRDYALQKMIYFILLFGYNIEAIKRLFFISFIQQLNQSITYSCLQFSFKSCTPNQPTHAGKNPINHMLHPLYNHPNTRENETSARHHLTHPRSRPFSHTHTHIPVHAWPTALSHHRIFRRRSQFKEASGGLFVSSAAGIRISPGGGAKTAKRDGGRTDNN